MNNEAKQIIIFTVVALILAGVASISGPLLTHDKKSDQNTALTEEEKREIESRLNATTTLDSEVRTEIHNNLSASSTRLTPEEKRAIEEHFMLQKGNQP